MNKFNILFLSMLVLCANQLSYAMHEASASASDTKKIEATAKSETAPALTTFFFWHKLIDDLKVEILSKSTCATLTATIRELARYQRVCSAFKDLARTPTVVLRALQPCTVLFTPPQAQAVKEFFSKNIRPSDMVTKGMVKSLYGFLEQRPSLMNTLANPLPEEDRSPRPYLFSVMKQNILAKPIRKCSRMLLSFSQTAEEKAELLELIFAVLPTSSEKEKPKLTELARSIRSSLKNERDEKIVKLLESAPSYATESSLSVTKVVGLLDAWVEKRYRNPLKYTIEKLISSCVSLGATDEQGQLEAIIQNDFNIKSSETDYKPSFWAAALLIAICKSDNDLIKHFLAMMPIALNPETQAYQVALLTSVLFYMQMVLPPCTKETIILFLKKICTVINERRADLFFSMLASAPEAEELFSLTYEEYRRHEISSLEIETLQAAAMGKMDDIQSYITNLDIPPLDKGKLLSLCMRVAICKGHFKIIKKIHDVLGLAMRNENLVMYKAFINTLKKIATKKNNKLLARYFQTLLIASDN